MNPALARLSSGFVEKNLAEALHKAGWALGSAVVDGRIQYFSVSQLQAFATCERLWWWDKIKHLPRKQTKALDVGTQAHKQWAHYLSTGEDVLGEIARIAKPKPPAPGPDLLVEQAFCPTDVPGGHLLSPVFAGGIPLVGDVDLVNPRQLSAGRIRVTDHKTSSNPAKYAATEHSLTHVDLEAIRSDAPGAPGAGIQMVGYGKWLLAKYGDVPNIELEHLITPTKASKKAIASGEVESTVVLATTTPAGVRREWQTVDRLAERAAVVAQMTEPPEPNWSACEKYGGCSFKAQCLTYQSKEKKPMGVMDMLKNKGNTSAAVPAPPPPAAPQAQVQAAPRVQIIDVPGYAATNAKQGERYTLPDGRIGTFLAAVNAFGGTVFYSFMPDGGGTPALLGADATIIPVPAPAPQPEPRVVYDAGQAPATPTTTAPVEVVQFQPPAAPLLPTPAPGQPIPFPPDGNQKMMPAAEEKPRRKRRTKAEMEAARAAGQDVPSDEQPAEEPQASELRIFVDAVPNGPTEPLAGYIAGIVGQIERAFSVEDIRCAPKKTTDGKDHPLAFGGWKGVLSAAVRSEPPKPGTYCVLGVTDTVAEVLAALEPLCAPGCYVRGVR